MTTLRAACRALLADWESGGAEIGKHIVAVAEAANAPPPGLVTPEISFEGENPGEDDERCESLVLRWPTLSLFIEAGEYAIKEGDGPAYRPGAHKVPSYGAALEIGDEIGKTKVLPPGLEEVRAKLETLYGMGFIDPAAYGHSAAADCLIAELLAIWEDRQPCREDDLR
jgi:hypothetical protein